VLPVTHTHALFAEQSQSILDNLMEIIGPELSLESLGPTWLYWRIRGFAPPNESNRGDE